MQLRYADAESELLAAASALEIGAGRHPRGDTASVAPQSVAADVVTQLVELYDAWGKSDKATDWRAKLPKEPATKTAAR